MCNTDTVTSLSLRVELSLELFREVGLTKGKIMAVRGRPARFLRPPALYYPFDAFAFSAAIAARASAAERPQSV